VGTKKSIGRSITRLAKRAKAPDGQRIHLGPEEAQDGRQQGQRARYSQPDDDRAGDADRAQDHEVEQHQPDQPEQDGQAGEEDSPPGRGHRRCHGLLARGMDSAGQLLAEAAGQQQRVVDAQPETEQRGQVEHEDGEGRDVRGKEDDRQGDDDRATADDDRHAGSDDAAEHEQQGQRGQRQRDEFAALKVVLGEHLDVAVEGRPAGEKRAHAGRLAKCCLHGCQRCRRVIRR
jgi:hypothetical protein